MMPGDWKCPGCGNHNFARNTSCRQCGLNLEDAGAALESGVAQTMSTPDVEQFLGINGIAAHAAEIFRRLAPKFQKAVMDAGSLAGARDPTAVLMSRIGKAQRGTLEQMPMSQGDWITISPEIRSVEDAAHRIQALAPWQV